MNFYDELGLTVSASAEEIRQAYKKLARLLHPDHQSDAPLRRMAELQMTRLNEIWAVLSDPARRERYDATLKAPAAELRTIVFQSPPARPKPRFANFYLSPGTWVWTVLLLLAAFGFALVFLYFEHDSAVIVYRSTEEGTPAPEPGPTRSARVQAPPLSTPVVAVGRPVPAVSPLPPAHETTQPDGPLAPFRTPEAAAPKPRQEPPAPVQTTAVVAPAAAPPPPPAVVTAKPAVPSRIPSTGTWLYVKPATEDKAGKNFAYRPEYIEMVVKPGRDGKVFGRYRGRFHVPDRPISAEVVFQFEGASAEGSNLLAWHASDGAAGQIRMKMISEGVMEVSWYTTQFGSAQTLASGTAVLYRD